MVSRTPRPHFTPGEDLVPNDEYFHVQCKEKNVNATFRTLSLRKSKPASVLHYGFTMTHRVPSNCLVYGLHYSIKQSLFITDSVKVFTHDCLVTPPYQQYILFQCKTISKMSIHSRLLPKTAKIEVTAKFYPLHPAIPLPRG